MGNVIGAKMILRTYHEPNPVAEMGAWLWSVTRLHVQIMRDKRRSQGQSCRTEGGKASHEEPDKPYAARSHF